MGQKRTSNTWLLHPFDTCTNIFAFAVDVAKMAKLMIALIFDDDEEESVQNLK